MSPLGAACGAQDTDVPSSHGRELDLAGPAFALGCVVILGPGLAISGNPRQTKSMQKGTLVRITKTKSDPGALLPPIPRGQFVPGVQNPEWGLPIGYVVEGVLLALVSKREPVCMMRMMRAGEALFGLFTSSPVAASRAKRPRVLHHRGRLRVPLGRLREHRLAKTNRTPRPAGPEASRSHGPKQPLANALDRLVRFQTRPGHPQRPPAR